MDRLICGDVGYGKTEVALRAAFKAAEDGKQVMFLVPTTVLAQQHFGTFSERLRDYPFTIDLVSRFRTPKRRATRSAAFGRGEVDILIGTHRLLSRDVRPKDLGLLIVDEEQRFGVKQKELLRQLKLEGRRAVAVRDADPAHAPDVARRPARHLRDRDAAGGPRGRSRPTSASTTRSSVAGDQARARPRRPGLLPAQPRRHDRRDRRARRALVPEARVSVGARPDGRGELERTMLDFLRGDADVLVCTSIVESGLDIPTANTLIVERADVFGLAAALPDPRPRRPLARARLRVPALPERAASPRRPRSASRRCPTTPSSARASRSPCATSRSAAPATCSARSSPATSRRSASSCTSMLDEAVRLLAGDAADEARRAGADGPAGRRLRAGRLRALRGGQDRDPPARGGRARGRPADHAARGARGPLRPACRTALDNLIRLQDARIKLGRAGARSVDFSGGWMAVAPIELDSRGAKALRERVPEAVFESGRSTVRVRLPDEPAERFRAVVAAAEAILETATEPPRVGDRRPLPFATALARITLKSAARPRRRQASSPPSSRRCGNDVPPNAVAKVGDETITQEEFDKWVETAVKGQAQGATAVVPGPARLQEVRRGEEEAAGARGPGQADRLRSSRSSARPSTTRSSVRSCSS